jgi:Arylsulfotransferase (ASST)
MDGANATMASGMTASHHDMTAIPGGFATLLWNSSGIDAPCSLVERTDSGTMTTIVANMNTVYTSSTFHTNSVHYYPSDNTYTLGDRNPNLYVKVSRTGQLLWQLGGTNPKDAAKQFSGAGTWSVNHGHHLLADGTFVLFNNGSMAGGASTMRLFKLNASNMTAMPGLTYTGSGVNSNVMGDAQMLPNGNILVTASQMGQITEVTPGGQVVATFKGNAFGYSEYRDSLYGPPPR